MFLHRVIPLSDYMNEEGQVEETGEVALDHDDCETSCDHGDQERVLDNSMSPRHRVLLDAHQSPHQLLSLIELIHLLQSVL